METYKKEMLDDIAQLATDNRESAKEWLDEITENGEIDYDKATDLDFLHDIGWGDYLTGNVSGSYYCNSAKAKETVEKRELLTDEGFLNYLRDNETHLEDLMDQGWEAIDVWARCYVIDYLLTGEEIVKALQKGIGK